MCGILRPFETGNHHSNESEYLVLLGYEAVLSSENNRRLEGCLHLRGQAAIPLVLLYPEV